MEELLYWGAILGFYLWSAYRSKKKKAERLMPQPQQTPSQKESDSPQIPNNQKINVLDFLNKAFEESISDKVVREPQVLKKTKDHSAKSTFVEHFDTEHDLSKIDDRHLKHIKKENQNLGYIKSRLHTKTNHSINNKNLLLLVQQKYKKHPTKLAITMQAIFESPKAMQ